MTKKDGADKELEELYKELKKKSFKNPLSTSFDLHIEESL